MHLVVWVIASIASIILMVKLRQLDSVLKSPDTPLGIVGYEFAWTRERAASMLRAWQGLGVLESARKSLLVDFAFLLACPISLGLGCRLLAAVSATIKFGLVLVAILYLIVALLRNALIRAR